jgi:hypothetical protein
MQFDCLTFYDLKDKKDQKKKVDLKGNKIKTHHILESMLCLFTTLSFTSNMCSIKLTPKIPSVFLPISAVSDLLEGIHFSTQKK